MNLRVIFVTCANGGLGQAIARAFLQESTGNIVWLGIRAQREHADLLAQEHPGKTAQMRGLRRRFGRPEEAAAAVCFLAGSDAGYSTGSALKIDGGIL
jgi:NAD(P)-dependent dehydrogenase (short-subunit alcohol dehydrogenase family)